MQRDDVLIEDILDAVRRIREYIGTKTREDFEGDYQCQDAVIRRLSIIGEAARQLTDDARAKYSQLPWRSIIGQRNILVHDYGGVDLEDIWVTVHESLPELVALLGPDSLFDK